MERARRIRPRTIIDFVLIQPSPAERAGMNAPEPRKLVGEGDGTGGQWSALNVIGRSLSDPSP
jgi:hypothetical protein